VANASAVGTRCAIGHSFALARCCPKLAIVQVCIANIPSATLGATFFAGDLVGVSAKVLVADAIAVSTNRAIDHPFTLPRPCPKLAMLQIRIADFPNRALGATVLAGDLVGVSAKVLVADTIAVSTNRAIGHPFTLPRPCSKLAMLQIRIANFPNGALDATVLAGDLVGVSAKVLVADTIAVSTNRAIGHPFTLPWPCPKLAMLQIRIADFPNGALGATFFAGDLVGVSAKVLVADTIAVSTNRAIGHPFTLPRPCPKLAMLQIRIANFPNRALGATVLAGDAR